MTSSQQPGEDRAAPVAAPVDEGAEAAGSRTLGFSFTGRGPDYFRIWITNIALSILTLGVYSAWAKVRTRRYFHGHTRLDGASFAYTADPVKVLAGRTIAAAVLTVYVVTSFFEPAFEGVFWLLFLFALPSLVVRAHRFSAHHTRYRGLRFGFDGAYGEAARAFILGPTVAMLSLGTLIPWSECRRQRFVLGSFSFGTTGFTTEVGARTFYKVYAKSGAVAALVVAVSIAIGVLTTTVGEVALAGAALALSAGVPFVVATLRAGLTNELWNGTRVDTHRFRSTLSAPELGWIYLSNLVATMLTLGLYYPFARVRIARYRAEHMTVTTDGDLDEFVAAAHDDVAATGEEMSDLFDIDIGI